MTTATRRRIAAGRALVTLALLALAAACGSAARPTGPPPDEAVPVQLGASEARSVPVLVQAVGAVEPFATVAVRAQVGGEVTSVRFAEGDEVARGQVLFTIDARGPEAAVRQAEAALARDRAQLGNARADATRYADLAAKDYVTREQYDRLVTTAAALEAQVKADEAVLDNARLALSWCTITAPVGGRAGKFAVWPGNVIKASDAPLVTLLQVRPVYVTFTVPESYLARIRERMADGKPAVEAWPNDASPGAGVASGAPLASGTLAFIDNAVDRATGTILLKARFENADGALWPGQFVLARLRLAERPEAIVVPSQAIQAGQAGSYVFVVKADHTVEMRPVVPADALDGWTVVDRGLAAGESVVLDGQLRLAPGRRVVAKGGEKGAEPTR